MQKKNKKNQKCIGENEKIDLHFFPDKGLGNISFLFQEKEVVDILGDPDEKEIIFYDEKEYAVVLYYFKKGIGIFFHYENENFKLSNIYLDDLILDQIKIFNIER